MPIYEYICNECQAKFEELKSISKRYKTLCPNCNSNDIKLCFSIPAKPIIRGANIPDVPIGEFPGDDDYKNTKERGYGWVP